MDTSAADPQTKALVAEWRATLTDRERMLHDLASLKLKKNLKPKDALTDCDNGSYYAHKCHAFKAWRKLK